MQKQYQPIKRSSQLAALSREHHEGLLFVWKIKQGIAFGVSPERIGKYCEWFWRNILNDHFKKEEAALTTLLPVSHPLINTMIEDHQAISVKMEEVIDDPSYYVLRRLAQIIYYHIRFEERSLFAYIEKVVPVENLEKVVKLLTVPPDPGTTWTDEFWIKKPERDVKNSPERTNNSCNL